MKIETSSPGIVFPQFHVFKTPESGLILREIKIKKIPNNGYPDYDINIL